MMQHQASPHAGHAEPAPAAHGGGHPSHSGHGHGDHVARFRQLFWVMLLLAVPVVALSPMFAMLLGYSVPVDGWLRWVPPLLGTVLYAWGGSPFLTGAVAELRARRPGMMLLIGLAITVAFAASWGATLGLLDHTLEFWWELALLIVIMLLGHWLEMRSLARTTSALDSLAALLPDVAEVVRGDGVVPVAPAELAVGDVVLVRPDDPPDAFLAVLVLRAHPRAEEDLRLPRLAILRLHPLQLVEPLGQELHAPIDLAELLLPVDVLRVLRPIPLRGGVRDPLHDLRPLHVPKVIELAREALVPLARDVRARLGPHRSRACA